MISGLVRRRRELAHDLLQAMARVDDLSRDLDALDHTLRMFDPVIALDTLPTLQSRPKPDWALRGEVVRIVFALLREAGAPMPTREIVEAVNRARGIEGEITFLQIKRVRKCLDRQRARGALQVVTVDGAQCWKIPRS